VFGSTMDLYLEEFRLDAFERLGWPHSNEGIS